MIRLINLNLEPGYYDIAVDSNPGISFVEISDPDDLERCCRLDLSSNRINYKIHLRRPLARILVNVTDKEPDVGGLAISFTKTTTNSFKTRKVFAALRRHALQSFGPGEKLLCLSKKFEDREMAAFGNVEFRYMHMYGIDDLSKEKNGWRWLDEGWRPAKTAQDYNGTLNSCIYVHLYYTETWPEISLILQEDCAGSDLIFSITDNNKEFEREIVSQFPFATVFVTENRGRDVGPFMELLKQGTFDKYDAVCKLHGKLSKKDGIATASGMRIRRYIFSCLLRDGSRNRILDFFHTIPDLGIVGPKNLSLPKAGRSVAPYIKDELKQLRQISKRVGFEFSPEELQFFVGTMFWFRPKALVRARVSQIGIQDFEFENGAKRATLQHSLERLFTLFARQTGFKVGAIQPATLSAKHVQTFEII